MLTKAKLLRMPAKKYMAQEQLEFLALNLLSKKVKPLVRLKMQGKDSESRQSAKMRLTEHPLKWNLNST